MFDDCLKKVLDPIPEWKVDSSNFNSSYLEFTFSDTSHTSQGAGDGYINIFNIVDSLYDSKEDNIILIDEPEISLHPDLQRKLFKLLVEYSKDKQIIISTHSPYFVDWEQFIEYSKVIRLKKENNIIKKYELSKKTKEEIRTILEDPCHPHILSLNTNEIFFLNDNIILTEGQEDVACYKKIFKNYNVKVNASFFGWGAGGAEKIEKILNMLKELGYEKVFVILDNNKKDEINDLKKKFSKYEYYAIQANDIRTKKDDKSEELIKEIRKMELAEDEKEKIVSLIESKSSKTVAGLVESRRTCKINKQYEEDVENLIRAINNYFNSECNVSQENIKTDYHQQDYINSETRNDENVKLEIATELLNKYLKANDLTQYIKKRYNFFKFSGGVGDLLSIKKINTKKYLAFEKIEASISQEHYISIIFKLIINLKNNKVKIARKRIVSNTLPISKLRKLKEKIMN